MARPGFGGVLGGAAAGAYAVQQANQNGWNSMWGMVPRFDQGLSTQGSSSTSNSDMKLLQGEISRLGAVIAELRKPTVVQLGGRNGWTVLLVPAAIGGLGIYVYCRLTGQGILDLLFVSRSSMNAFRTTVQDGLANVWGEMRKQKDEVIKMFNGLGRKQDNLQEKQERMNEVLNRVDSNVHELDSKAAHTIQHVDRMDNRLQDVHVGVQAANQGIYMMMSVISEVTHKIGLHNSRASQALQRYLQGGPAWRGPADSIDYLTSGSISSDGSSKASASSLKPLPALPSEELVDASCRVGLNASKGSSKGLRDLVDEGTSMSTLSAPSQLGVPDHRSALSPSWPQQAHPRKASFPFSLM